MTARKDLPPGLVAGPFSVSTALDLGVSRSRLKSSDLATPFWGIRTTEPPTSVHEFAAAYLSRSSRTHAISHASAAQLWQFPLPSRLEEMTPLHVTVPSARARPKSRGTIGHHALLQDHEVLDVAGIRLTSQARTWFDLAPSLSEEELIGLGDFLVWRRRPYGLRQSADTLQRALESFSGRRGVPALKRAIPFLSDRADSVRESHLRVRFSRAGLPAVEVNPRIYDDYGNFVAMVDLAWPEYQVIVEYEGDQHRTDAHQWEKDIARVPHLQDLGWHHTRVSKADIRDSSMLLFRMDRILRARGWNPPEPKTNRRRNL